MLKITWNVRKVSNFPKREETDGERQQKQRERAARSINWRENNVRKDNVVKKVSLRRDTRNIDEKSDANRRAEMRLYFTCQSGAWTLEDSWRGADVAG